MHSPNEGKPLGGPAVLERVHSFSVNKQQVSIVQVNSSPSPATLNFTDHSDIQYVDSEEVAHPPAAPPAAAGRLFPKIRPVGISAIFTA